MRCMTVRILVGCDERKPEGPQLERSLESGNVKQVRSTRILTLGGTLC
jgi:hypothetical protein